LKFPCSPASPAGPPPSYFDPPTGSFSFGLRPSKTTPPPHKPVKGGISRGSPLSQVCTPPTCLSHNTHFPPFDVPPHFQFHPRSLSLAIIFPSPSLETFRFEPSSFLVRSRCATNLPSTRFKTVYIQIVSSIPPPAKSS